MSETGANEALIIREITALSEMLELEELQKEVWGVNDREVSSACISPLNHCWRPIAWSFLRKQDCWFRFRFPGLEQGRIILHSDMLAVLPEYRSRGLGYKLKLAQRDQALQRGIDTITWTFDPLQLINANLNFAKLGVTSERYLVNFYGETSSFLHSSGTDRLWLTWALNSERVRQRLSDAGDSGYATEFNQARVIVGVTDENEPMITLDIPLEAAVVIEIPSGINSLGSDLRVRWREATRRLLHTHLEVASEFRNSPLVKRISDRLAGICWSAAPKEIDGILEFSDATQQQSVSSGPRKLNLSV